MNHSEENFRTTIPTNINEYIAAFPADVQIALQQIRETIQNAAPEAVETIKYAMPTFTLKGNFVYFAAFKNHIGLYSVPTHNQAFIKDFSAYKTGKGSVQFPLNQPMPLDFIRRIIEFKVAERVG